MWNQVREVPAFLRMDALMSREHMDKVRPRTGREGALGYVRSDHGDDIAFFLQLVHMRRWRITYGS